jgi:catalase
MVTEQPWPVAGRVVHILAADGADLDGVDALRELLLAAGVAPHVVAPHKGAIRTGDRELTVDRSFHTSSSAEADALIVAADAGLAENPIVQTYVQAAYRHFKTIGAWGDGSELLAATGCDVDADGVVVAEAPDSTFADSFVAAMARHRHWERAATHPTRELTGASR